MSSTDKDEFDRIAAYILKKLDEEFPKPIFRIRAEEVVDESDENAVMIFCYTIIFLQRENILSYSSDADTGTQFGEVMLTGKGLALLNSTPGVLKGKPTFRGRIGDALKGSSKEVLKVTINQLIKNAVEGKFDLPGL